MTTDPKGATRRWVPWGVVAACVIGIACGAAWVVRRSGGYTRTEVLRYLPEDCRAARVYVDVAALFRAVGSSELVESARERGKFRELVKALGAAGIDVGRDVKDFAICAREIGKDEDDRSSVYVAVGGSLGGKDALARYKSVVMALAHVDAGSVIEGQSDGVPYLVSKHRRSRVWIGMPAPDVLLFSTDSVTEAGKRKVPRAVLADQWSTQVGTIATVDYSPEEGPDEPHAHARVTEDHGTLVLDGTGRFSMLRNLDAAKLEIIRSRTADMLARSPLESLADPLRHMDLVLTGGEIHAHLRVADETVAKALVKIQADPSIVASILLDLAKKPEP